MKRFAIAFVRFYKRYILFTLKNLSIYFINYNKKSFSSVKTFLIRAVVFILIASVISGVAVIINTRSTKVEATKVILNGDTVGYIKTEESAEKIAGRCANAGSTYCYKCRGARGRPGL